MSLPFVSSHEPLANARVIRASPRLAPIRRPPHTAFTRSAPPLCHQEEGALAGAGGGGLLAVGADGDDNNEADVKQAAAIRAAYAAGLNTPAAMLAGEAALQGVRAALFQKAADANPTADTAYVARIARADANAAAVAASASARRCRAAKAAAAAAAGAAGASGASSAAAAASSPAAGAAPALPACWLHRFDAGRYASIREVPFAHVGIALTLTSTLTVRPSKSTAAAAAAGSDGCVLKTHRSAACLLLGFSPTEKNLKALSGLVFRKQAAAAAASRAMLTHSRDVTSAEKEMLTALHDAFEAKGARVNWTLVADAIAEAFPEQQPRTSSAWSNVWAHMCQ